MTWAWEETYYLPQTSYPSADFIRSDQVAAAPLALYLISTLSAMMIRQ